VTGLNPLESFGESLSKRPVQFVAFSLIVTIVLTGLFAWSVATERTEIRTDLTAMFPSYEEADQLMAIGEDFGNVDPLIVLVEADDVLTPEVFRNVTHAMIDAMEDEDINATIIPPVDQSVLSVPQMLGSYKAMLAGQTPTNANILAQVESYTSGAEIRADIRAYIADPMIPAAYRDYLVVMFPQDFDPASNEPQTTMAAYVMMNRSIDIEVREAAALEFVTITEEYEEGFMMYCYSESLMNPAFMEAEMAMEPLIGMAFMLLLVIMYINYRRGTDVLLSCLALLIAILWVFGLIAITGWPLDFFMFMIPLLLLGLGIDFSFHTIIGYRERLGDGSIVSLDDRIRNSIRINSMEVGLALILATATTAFGFASNATASTPMIVRFGLVTAFGIIAACVVNLTFVQGMLMILDQRYIRKGKEDRVRIIEIHEEEATAGPILKAGKSSLKWPIPFLVLSLLLAAPGYLLIDDLRGSYDPTSELLDDQDLTIAFRTFNEEFDVGTEYYVVRVDGDLSRAALWAEIDAALVGMEDDEYVIMANGTPRTEWLGQMLEDLAILSNETMAAYMAVDTDMDGSIDTNATETDIDVLLDLLYMDPQVRSLLHKGDSGYDGVIIRIYTRTTMGYYGMEAKEEIAEDFENVTAGDSEVIVTGMPIIWARGITDVRDSMAVSTMLCIIFAFVLLVGLFQVRAKAPQLGLFIAIPPMLVVGWTLGTMALIGLKLNMMTAFVGALTIGLGIDYPIHVGNRWFTEKQQGKTRDQAYFISISSTGKEVLYSSLTTFVVFIFFAMMPMEIMKEFGIVMSLGIIYSLIGAIFVLPLMMALWHKDEEGVVDGGPVGSTPEEKTGSEASSDGSNNDSSDDDEQETGDHTSPEDTNTSKDSDD